MKILHVIPALSTIYGGPSIAMHLIAKSLVNSGMIIDIVTTNADGENELNVPLGKRIEKNNIGYYYFARQMNEWKFSWSLTKWLNENIFQYDIIHIHSIFCYPTWVASYLAKKHGKPYIIRPAGILDAWCMQQKWFKKKLYYYLIEKRNINKASGIHVTTDLELESLHQYGINKNIFIIPHAVSDCQFISRRSPEDDSEMRLLFVSRLDPKKGLLYLFDAMKLLNQSSRRFKLTIAGNGHDDYVIFLKTKIKLLKIEQDVNFVGFADDEKKRQLYADHHVFVLPSFQENFGLSVAEALASGMPVVVSDQVGLAKSIQHFDAGEIVPLDQTKQLATAIQSLWLKQRWEQCQQNAMLLTEKTLSLNMLSQNLIAMYKNMMKNR